MERNRVFSIIIISVIIVVVVIVTMNYVNDFKRVAVDVSVKSRVSKIHLCLALHMNLREL